MVTERVMAERRRKEGTTELKRYTGQINKRVLKNFGEETGISCSVSFRLLLVFFFFPKKNFHSEWMLVVRLHS